MGELITGILWYVFSGIQSTPAPSPLLQKKKINNKNKKFAPDLLFQIRKEKINGEFAEQSIALVAINSRILFQKSSYIPEVLTMKMDTIVSYL